ncbi:MAG: alpha/beta hydrolase [Chloroflexota bacterium]|nr:lysophospholipase [Chloroflexota bacterium]MBI5705200.1 alpha/beta hydrolase [Chloroflexota bacterium]
MTSSSTSEMNDDITFYMQGWEPQGTPKAIVCLVHGLGEHTGRYAHVGKALNDAGYALVGFDLRGHGQSGGPRGHFPSLETVLNDIHNFVHFQRQSHPRLPLFLYGHSLGGLLTLTYALRHPEGLQGVIVTGAGLRSALQEQKAKIMLVKALGSLIPTLSLKSELEVNGLSHDAAVVQAYVNDPLVHDKVSLGLGKAGLDAIEFCFARARDFRPPLLIMHGGADRITYPSGSEDFAKLAGETNKDVTLKIWEGLYHEIHNEPQQADVFQTMIEWLNRHL